MGTILYCTEIEIQQSIFFRTYALTFEQILLQAVNIVDYLSHPQMLQMDIGDFAPLRNGYVSAENLKQVHCLGLTFFNKVCWQIGEQRRGLNPLTDSEKCQCCQGCSQRNLLACCYRA